MNPTARPRSSNTGEAFSRITRWLPSLAVTGTIASTGIPPAMARTPGQCEQTASRSSIARKHFRPASSCGLLPRNAAAFALHIVMVYPASIDKMAMSAPSSKSRERCSLCHSARSNCFRCSSRAAVPQIAAMETMRWTTSSTG